MKRFRGGLITLIASATTNQAGAHAADVTPRCIGFFVHFFQRRTVLLLQGKKFISEEISGELPLCGLSPFPTAGKKLDQLERKFTSSWLNPVSQEFLQK